MVARKGLGRGLDSMIPDRVDDTNSIKKKKSTDNVSRETLINISEIEPNRSQPRKNFNEDGIHELADSIKQYGIIQPLILQKKDKYYEIIAGERRWRAAKIAGVKKVPAIIKNYNSQEIMEIALIENIQREDLNPIEEALAYQNLIEEFNLKQDEVAEKVSKSRSTITNAMRLLRLDKRVQLMIIDDMISNGHGRALLGIEDQELQYQMAMKIFDEKLSVRETESAIKKLQEKPVKKDTIKESELIIYKDLEEKIRDIIGTKVSILKKAKNKGKIEIEYYSNDELERIISMFETMKQ